MSDETTTGLGIGDALRNAREERGQTVEEIARTTKVRSEYLRALENEEFERMGGDVYAKGFLKTYANALGLEAEGLLVIYRRRVQGSSQALSGSLAKAPVAREPRGAPPMWLAWSVVGVIVLIGVFALASIIGGTSPDPAGRPRPPTAATPTPTPSVTPTPTTQPEPVFEGVNIELVFQADSYIRVEIDGVEVENTTARQGATLTFQGEETVFVRFGNAGGVQVILNGRDLGMPGSPGQVLNVTYTENGPS